MADLRWARDMAWRLRSSDGEVDRIRLADFLEAACEALEPEIEKTSDVFGKWNPVDSETRSRLFRVEQLGW